MTEEPTQENWDLGDGTKVTLMCRLGATVITAARPPTTSETAWLGSSSIGQARGPNLKGRWALGRPEGA